MSVANLRIQQKIQKIKQNFEIQKAQINKIDFEYTSPVQIKQLLNNPSNFSKGNGIHSISQQNNNDDELYIKYESVAHMPVLQLGVDRLFSYNQFRLNEQKTCINANRFKSPAIVRPANYQNEYLNIDSSANLLTQVTTGNGGTSRNRAFRKKYNSFSINENQDKPKTSRLLELSMQKSQSRVMKILNKSVLEDDQFSKMSPTNKNNANSIYKIIEPTSPQNNNENQVDEGVMKNDFGSLPKIQNQKSFLSLQPKGITRRNQLQLLEKNYKSEMKKSPRSMCREPSQADLDRKLTRDISKEQDCFKRQKMLFELHENSKDRVVDISGIFDPKHVQHLRKSRLTRNHSVLKTEKSNSSVIQSIKSIFPYNAGFDIGELVKFDTDQERILKVQDILNSQNPIKKYQSEQKTQKQLDLQQGLFRKKMITLNREVTEKYIDLSNKCLNDDFMYQLIQQKNSQLSNQKPIKLNSTKVISKFDIQGWKNIEEICDHRGNQISKQGYKMGEVEAEKEQERLIKQKHEQQQQQLRKISMYKSNKSKMKTGTSEDLFKASTQQIKISSILNGDLNFSVGQDRLLNTDADIDGDVDDRIGSGSENENENHSDQLKENELDEQDKLDEKRTIQFEKYKDDRDKELKMRVIKKKSNQTIDSGLKKQQKSYISRHQTIQMKIKLKQEAEQQRIEQIKLEMEQEEEEYWEEWRQIKQEEMLGQIDVFLEHKKSQILQVNNDILEIENDSEKDLEIFDNFISTNANKAMKINKQFKDKIQKNQNNVKDLLITKQNYDEISSPDKNIIDQQDSSQVQEKLGEARGNKGFQKALHNAQQKIEFGELIQEVYQKAENMDYDKPKPQEKVQGDEDDDDYYSEDEKQETLEDIAQKAREKEEMKDNMSKKYIQSCRDEKVLPLPTVHKIIDGVLTLDEYKLNTGQCKALGAVLEDLGTDIYKIVLKNNGIDDNAYSYIIEGAVKNPNITSLVNIGNQFKEQSLKQIVKYFDRSRRAVLQELVISGCKTNLTLMNKLLKELSEYSNLQSLGICQSKLDKESVEYIADIINGNIKLRELDLSWNEVTCLNMGSLIQNIEYCRHVSYVNLSYNSIIGVPAESQEIINSLCNFIRRNKNLMHLDLSYCGLKRDQLFQVIESCKKSRSLLAVHVTGNLITEETKIKIRQFMRPRKRVKDLYDKINAPDSDDDTSANAKKMDLSEAIQEKLNKYETQDDHSHAKDTQGAKKGNPGERLVFTRILGHFEIPRSHKWQESTECWICDKHQYTVFCMTKSIARKLFIQPKLKDKQAYKDKIDQARNKQDDTLLTNNDDQWGSDNDELFYEGDTEDQKMHYHLNNQIAGTFSNWKCRSFLPLSTFILKLKKNKLPQTRVINAEKTDFQKQVEHQKVVKAQQLLVKQQRLNQYRQTLHSLGNMIDKDEDSGWLDKITYSYAQDLDKKNWLKELENIQDQTNFVISLEELQNYKKPVNQLREKMYVYAAYIPPGKHNTCVLYNTQNEPKKSILNLIIYVKPRQLPLQLKQKKIKEYKITRKFQKSISIFKDWTDDSAKNLKAALQKDLDYSKCSRFIKDHFEFTRLKEVLLRYTAVIKDIFTYSIAISSFPSISWIDFTLLCNMWQIPDKASCTMQTIDRIFIAVNVEVGQEHEDNPDRDLCRYEFYEIIVRMGGAKFRDSGQCVTWDQAAEMIIEKCLIPNTPMMGGQTFRDKYIWTLPIDDLLRANYDSIQKLYNKNTSAMKRYLDLDICKQIVAPLEINEPDIIQAYAFSKITIIDEMETKDKYDKMVLVEFIDFLCRCAYIKYQQETHLTFLEKCERVLDILFKGVIGAARKKPDFEIEVSSQSDYSSDD